MRLLPGTAALPRSPILRRHTPKENSYKGAYKTFRDCLRWDFGFECPLCLAHEADWVVGLGQGVPVGGRYALFTIEHLVPRSRSRKKSNKYMNCVYACRPCNTARGARPQVRRTDGARLLNPSETAWADRFGWQGFRLVPNDPNDRDAQYTIEAYDLNSVDKCALRRIRRQFMSRILIDVLNVTERIALLNKIAEEPARTSSERIALIREIEIIREARRRTIKEMRRFTPMPRRRPKKCACSNRGARRVPPHIASSTVTFDVRSL